jgi:hypothetical protein
MNILFYLKWTQVDIREREQFLKLNEGSLLKFSCIYICIALKQKIIFIKKINFSLVNCL